MPLAYLHLRIADEAVLGASPESALAPGVCALGTLPRLCKY